MRERLARYSGRYCVDADDEEPDTDSFAWTRLGVTAGDFDGFNLVRLPVKHSDMRSKAFLRNHGEDCAEVDALPPSELRRRVEAAIDSHIDVERWNRLLKIEAMEQEQLNQLVEGLKSRK